MSSVSIERILGFKDKREKRFHHPNLDELQGWKATQDEKISQKIDLMRKNLGR